MFEIRLYTFGKTHRSRTIIEDLKAFLEQNFSKRYSLEVIDLLEEPASADRDNIIATPTLVRKAPLPEKKIIGDFQNHEKIMLMFEMENSVKKPEES
jgi:circadian clock protein KaiB